MIDRGRATGEHPLSLISANVAGSDFLKRALSEEFREGFDVETLLVEGFCGDEWLSGFKPRFRAFLERNEWYAVCSHDASSLGVVVSVASVFPHRRCALKV